MTFYPERNLSLDEVKTFVQSFPEGEWGAGGQTCRGIIESEDGRVYVDYDDRFRDYLEKYLDAREQSELTSRLGFLPTLALHVLTSSAFRHSRELARSVCEELAMKWGGGWSE